MLSQALKIISDHRRMPSVRILNAIYGPQAKHLRQAIVLSLTGVSVPVSSKACQYGNLREALLKAAGITGDCVAEEDSKFEAFAEEMLSRS